MSTSHSKFAMLALLFSMLGIAHAQPNIQRYGMTKKDEFRLCAAKVFGKPLLLARHTMNIVVPCPTGKEELIKQLEAKQVQVIDFEDVLYLLDVGPLFKEFPPTWSYLSEETEAECWGAIPGSRQLDEKQRESVAQQIIQNTRPVPIATPRESGPDGETGEIKYHVYLDAHHLSSRIPESIIAIVGDINGPSRLVYGELRSGRYQILWESALFSGMHLKLGYADVNGDGVEEILLGSTFGWRGEGELLIILDRKGVELTRNNDDCNPPLDYSEEESTCPIKGASISLEDGVGKMKDIVVKGSTESDTQDARYRLKGGIYKPKN